MKLTPEQLEWIVQEVVRRLRSSTTGSPTPHAAASLTLADRLVTTETLRDRLDGIARVEVPPKAIVTPAVVDLLRERQITLVRNAKE